MNSNVVKLAFCFMFFCLWLSPTHASAKVPAKWVPPEIAQTQSPITYLRAALFIRNGANNLGLAIEKAKTESDWINLLIGHASTEPEFFFQFLLHKQDTATEAINQFKNEHPAPTEECANLLSRQALEDDNPEHDKCVTAIAAEASWKTSARLWAIVRQKLTELQDPTARMMILSKALQTLVQQEKWAFLLDFVPEIQQEQLSTRHTNLRSDLFQNLGVQDVDLAMEKAETDSDWVALISGNAANHAKSILHYVVRDQDLLSEEIAHRNELYPSPEECAQAEPHVTQFYKGMCNSATKHHADMTRWQEQWDNIRVKLAVLKTNPSHRKSIVQACMKILLIRKEWDTLLIFLPEFEKAGVPDGFVVQFQEAIGNK